MKPIVVVDDKLSVRLFLKKLLSRAGFEILVTHDGASAISVIREFGGNVAALVSGVEMKGMNGIVLAKAVAGEFPLIPVLFTTSASISEEDLRQDVPRCVLLRKPFLPKALIRSLWNLAVRPDGELPVRRRGICDVSFTSVQ
jgi:CheY-like chemotaxis protein